MKIKGIGSTGGEEVRPYFDKLSTNGLFGAPGCKQKVFLTRMNVPRHSE